MDKQEGSDYTKALFSIGVFGGVQVIVILISILKNKLLAVWIGVEGYGIQNLLYSTITLFFIISNCGLQSSSVRDIAAESGNEYKLYSKIASIKWWNKVLGFIGMSGMLFMSPLLAKWVFNDITKWYWFAILSPTILFMNLYNGYYSILQGVRKVKLLAKASLYGAVSGFICSMPLFYVFKNEGIVPALFVLMLSTLIVSYVIYNRAGLPTRRNNIKDNYQLGLSTIKLGLALSINSIFVESTAFLLKILITNHGGVNEVGLFQAGWAINSSYISVVFTAMAKDYLPRLSQISSDNKLLSKSIKQQGIISVLILLPLLALLMVFVELVVKILYTKEFLAITTMTACFLFGSLIKASSWSIAYVFIAKADKKVFLFNELSTRALVVPIYMVGYYLYGLNGLGGAFIVEHILYFLWIGVSAYKLYGIKYDGEFWKLFLVSIIILSLLLILKLQGVQSIWPYLAIVLLSIVFSALQLLQRVDITSMIKRKRNEC